MKRRERKWGKKKGKKGKWGKKGWGRERGKREGGNRKVRDKMVNGGKWEEEGKGRSNGEGKRNDKENKRKDEFKSGEMGGMGKKDRRDDLVVRIFRNSIKREMEKINEKGKEGRNN